MKIITFCPSKRHYQPRDLVAAADKIRSIGSDIVKANISFKIFKDDYPESRNFGKIHIELCDTDASKKSLLLVEFEAVSSRLLIERALVDLNCAEDGGISLEEITSLCSRYDRTSRAHCISTTINEIKDKSTGSYYVYRHLFKDGRSYIGKGKGSRAKTIDGRNFAYQRAIAEMGEPTIEKLCQKMSENSAYELECTLIERLREHHGFNFLLNRTGGMEKAEVSDMPVSTIQALVNIGKMNIEETKKEETVNIFKRYEPDPGSAKLYFKDMSIYDAAKWMRCTMNDVIKAKGQKQAVINGYSILNDEEFECALRIP